MSPLSPAYLRDAVFTLVVGFLLIYAGLPSPL